nr:homeobox protein NOBOX [Nothobranchius furzeri]
MDEDRDVPEDFGCPSLLCEELEDLETKNSKETTRRDEEVSDQGDNEETREEAVHGDTKEEEKKAIQVALSEMELTVMEERLEESQDVQQIEGTEEETNANKQKAKVAKGSAKKSEQKKSRKRRGKKQSDQVRSRRAVKDTSAKLEEEKESQVQEMPAMSPEENLALLEPSVSLLSNCDLSDSVYLGLEGTGVFCPPVPVPLLYSQPPVQIQPEPPQSHGTKRAHSPPQCHSLPPQTSQTLEVEITPVYSTRRSVRHNNNRGRSRARSIPPLPELENLDGCPLPPAPKKTRTLYSADQLAHLEALFQEDHYPDAEKRKVIAAAVGVTPQRIMVWFQNRRAKWRKARSVTGKAEPSQSSINPNHNINPSMTVLAANRKEVPVFSSHFAAALPQLAPTAPFPTQTPPSLSSLLDSLNSPDQCRGRDVGQHQPSAQGGLPEYHPRPMRSPPPLRRASLPLFTSSYNTVGTNLPLLNTTGHTPPLFLDALEGGSSSGHCDTQTLQTDTSSLFDFAEKLSYPTSSQQSSSLYQGQSSYPTRQQQQQPQTSVPHMAYLTLSPYLTPNPPDSNPTSYLTFGPGGNSSGVVTYSTMGHSYLPPQNSGQILLQPAAHNSGITAFPSYPWNNLYNQPATLQRAQHPSAYPPSMGSAPDHQIPTTSGLPQHSFFPLVDHGSSFQHSSCTQTQTDNAALQPVSSLRLPHLRGEITPNKASSSLLSSQVSSPSPESPIAPSCVKMDSDSPREIHSHFHCDFSPIHF